ncbi:MAG: flagellar hook-basal body complex protein FliE [Deltaproteobacteria bacterium]|nr:flagellar hook-basal body complex protein FliE [Deltaproteobacteria bacterium]
MNPLTIEGLAPKSQFTTLSKKLPAQDGFGDRFKDALSEVNRLQHKADSAIEKVAKGELGVHEGMMAIAKADLSLRLLTQVRNKVLEAYREISRM